MKQIFIKVLLKVLLNLGDYNPLVMIDNGMDVLYLPWERNIRNKCDAFNIIYMMCCLFLPIFMWQCNDISGVEF